MRTGTYIEVLDLNRRDLGVLKIITRNPTYHVGWQSVRYNNKRYQLHGGIRNNEFINLSNPIK